MYVANSCQAVSSPNSGTILWGYGEPDTSASRHFGTTAAGAQSVPKFKTNHRWSCVSIIGIVLLGRSVPAFPRSRHSCRSVSYHVFGVQECLDAEVSGNHFMPDHVCLHDGSRCIVPVAYAKEATGVWCNRGHLDHGAGIQHVPGLRVDRHHKWSVHSTWSPQ